MTEIDPTGKQAHEPGAKLDSGKNRLGLVLLDFGNALKAAGEVGTFGANKYSPHGWLSVEDGRERYTDAMMRHLFAGPDDVDVGLSPEDQVAYDRMIKNIGSVELAHDAQTAWNALARLELRLRETQ